MLGVRQREIIIDNLYSAQPHTRQAYDDLFSVQREKTWVLGAGIVDVMEEEIQGE